MEQDTRLLYLCHTIIALWVWALVFMVLVWGWTALSRQEPPRLKRPGLNLKEL